MIGVVIPCYKVSAHIVELLQKIGNEVDAIYVVDDCCPEKSGALVERTAGTREFESSITKQTKGLAGP